MLTLSDFQDKSINSNFKFTEEKTFSGKEVNINGVWYSVTVKAKSLKDALSKLNNNRKYRGRFVII